MILLFQSENKSKQKYWQILGPCLRTNTLVKHKADTNQLLLIRLEESLKT